MGIGTVCSNFLRAGYLESCGVVEVGCRKQKNMEFERSACWCIEKVRMHAPEDAEKDTYLLVDLISVIVREPKARSFDRRTMRHRLETHPERGVKRSVGMSAVTRADSQKNGSTIPAIV